MARTKTTKSVETAAPVVVESVIAASVTPVVKKAAAKKTKSEEILRLMLWRLLFTVRATRLLIHLADWKI